MSNQLNMSQQRALLARKDNLTLRCMRYNASGKSCSLLSTGETHLEHWVQVQNSPVQGTWGILE